MGSGGLACGGGVQREMLTSRTVGLPSTQVGWDDADMNSLEAGPFALSHATQNNMTWGLE